MQHEKRRFHNAVLFTSMMIVHDSEQNKRSLLVFGRLKFPLATDEWIIERVAGTLAVLPL